MVMLDALVVAERFPVITSDGTLFRKNTTGGARSQGPPRGECAMLPHRSEGLAGPLSASNIEQ